MGGGVDTIGGSPLEDELAELSLIFTEGISQEEQAIPQEYIDASKEWLKKQYEVMTDSGVLAKIDSAGMEQGRMIWLFMHTAYKTVVEFGMYYQVDGLWKTHPAVGDFVKLEAKLDRWITAHAGNPMARHNKNMNLEPTGGTASHGNRKDPLLDIINE